MSQQNENPAKIFILGVGAQKAGTTWLARYLREANNVCAGHLKEYHIWDALTLPLCEKFRVAPSSRPSGDIAAIRLMMQNDTSKYFQYFTDILKGEGKSVAFDITPSYAGLSPAVFSHIAERFRDANVMVKTVFLMRDPVERCWSAARMMHQKYQTQTVQPDDVLRYALSGESDMRTRYDRTIASLRASFSPDASYIGLYEEMFSEERMRQLSRFCGVAFEPRFAEKKVNTTPKEVQLNERVIAAIARHYGDVYRSVAADFPAATRLWRGYGYL